MLITHTERLHWRLNPNGSIAFGVEQRIVKLRRKRNRWAIYQLAIYMAFIVVGFVVLGVAFGGNGRVYAKC